jgi:multidrug efflux pump subunit AcrB
VNDFNRFGRTWRVLMQAEPQFRVRPDDINQFHVRGRDGDMTSFAFLLGVLPLVAATGAGAASRRALGTAVFGGMATASLLGVFIIPVLYVVIQRFAEHRTRSQTTTAPAGAVEVSQ